MKAPANWEKMTDEELKQALLKVYDEQAAQYVFDMLRGNVDHSDNGAPIYE